MRIVPRHEVFVPETLAKFIQPLVQSPPGFTDIHQEIFSGRPDPVEAGIFGNYSEFVFVCGERDPWGPGEGAPIIGKEVQKSHLFGDDFSFKIATSAGKFRICIFLWQFGQSATVFSIVSSPSSANRSI